MPSTAWCITQGSRRSESRQQPQRRRIPTIEPRSRGSRWPMKNVLTHTRSRNRSSTSACCLEGLRLRLRRPIEIRRRVAAVSNSAWQAITWRTLLGLTHGVSVSVRRGLTARKHDSSHRSRQFSDLDSAFTEQHGITGMCNEARRHDCHIVTAST